MLDITTKLTMTKSLNDIEQDIMRQLNNINTRIEMLEREPPTYRNIRLLKSFRETRDYYNYLLECIRE